MYEEITFDTSKFDKIDWHSIDDELITDIHRTAHILPCTFPPVSYYESQCIDQSSPESKPKMKTGKGQNLATEIKIKPKDDSEWVTKRLETRKTMLAKPKKLQKRRKNAAKKQKRKEKLLSKKCQKTTEQLEANEMAALKAISIDEYKSVDEPIEPTLNISMASEPRLTRKRASQHFATETVKPINIASAQHEIAKRRAPGFTSPTHTVIESASESGTEHNPMVTTRSGRVVRTRQK